MWDKLSDEDIFAMEKPSYNKILSQCEYVENYLDKINRNSTLLDPSPDTFNPLDLIGLGIGLTPSGDDFLAGMLHAIHFWEILYGKKHPHLPIIADIIAKNLHRTGAISRHFLHYALKGEWGCSTENVLLALFSDNHEKLYDAVNIKLSYGASSGADELRGCLFGIREACTL